jgi:hypothetical protein
MLKVANRSEKNKGKRYWSRQAYNQVATFSSGGGCRATWATRPSKPGLMQLDQGMGAIPPKSATRERIVNDIKKIQYATCYSPCPFTVSPGSCYNTYSRSCTIFQHDHKPQWGCGGVLRSGAMSNGLLQRQLQLHPGLQSPFSEGGHCIVESILFSTT